MRTALVVGGVWLALATAAGRTARLKLPTLSMNPMAKKITETSVG
jgi:hypothetical protein